MIVVPADDESQHPIVWALERPFERFANMQRFVCWRHMYQKDSKPKKVPIHYKTLTFASSTNSETWANSWKCLASALKNSLPGIGIVLNEDGLVGIDLDRCIDETGNIAPWAQQIVTTIDSYTEISPSGKGLHIFALSTEGLVPGRRKNGNVEIYANERYLTITGDHLPGTPETIEDRGIELRQVHSKYLQAESNLNNIRDYKNLDHIPDGESRHNGILRRIAILKKSGAPKEFAFEFGLFLIQRHNSTGRRIITVNEVQKMLDFAYSHKSTNDFQPPQLWDPGRLETWPAEPLEWLVQGLIPKGGIGFLSGAPKDGKSLLAIDLVVHMAHGKSWLGRFNATKVNTLYIAREDPLGRIRERISEINTSYGYPQLTSGILQFMSRDRFDLMNDSWINWLRNEVEAQGFEFLILDVLNRMIPGLDELSAKDMAKMVDRLELLNRDLNLTILCIDHTRKPSGLKSLRDGRSPNPFDLKGSIAKYGCADFMLCLSRTNHTGKLQLYCENKDTDERPHFFIDVSAKNSGKQKFSYASSVQDLVNSRLKIGDENRMTVHAVLNESVGKKRLDLEQETGLKESTIRKHLSNLKRKGMAFSKGEGKNTMWFRSANAKADNDEFNAFMGIHDNE